MSAKQSTSEKKVKIDFTKWPGGVCCGSFLVFLAIVAIVEVMVVPCVKPCFYGKQCSDYCQVMSKVFDWLGYGFVVFPILGVLLCCVGSNKADCFYYERNDVVPLATVTQP